MSPGANYLQVKENIAAAAAKYGRDPADILIVAVSKNQQWPQAMSAYESGCRDFGENRVQEALDKMQQAPPGVLWHLIGTLQSNKINKALGRFTLIHSIDSPQLAKKVSEASASAGCTTSILLQVNTSGERSKHGLSTEEWKRNFENVLNCSNIQIEGLMTIGPYVENEGQIRRCFSCLRDLRDELKNFAGANASLQHLSMGMSHDYPLAIAEGATILRIGTAIFGAREI